MTASDTPRFAAISPYSSAAFLRLFASVGVDSATIRREVHWRRQHGHAQAATDLEHSWRQLQASAADHAHRIGKARPDPAEDTTTEGVPVERAAGRTVSTDVAARELGISTRRVRQLLASGALPGTLTGRTWVVDADGLAETVALRQSLAATG